MSKDRPTLTSFAPFLWRQLDKYRSSRRSPSIVAFVVETAKYILKFFSFWHSYSFDESFSSRVSWSACLTVGKRAFPWSRPPAPPWNLLNRSSQILCHALSHDATTLAPFFDRSSVFVNRLCFQAFLYPWLPGIWSNPCMTVRFTCRWNE